MIDPVSRPATAASAVASQSCTTMGHGGEQAAAVVNLYDCDCGDRGECVGHPYCRDCVDVFAEDPENVIAEWLREPLDPEVEQVFDEFWRDIVMPHGAWDFDQVKRELHDCHIYVTEVPKVYDEITRGRISKPNTLANVVLTVHTSVVDANDTLIEEAVRGFFMEKHVPLDTADEWTDQVMNIVWEHRV